MTNKNFAHDLRNSLNHILGFNDLLTSDLSGRSAPQETIEMFRAVSQKGEFLQTFIATWFGDIGDCGDWRMPALEALAFIQNSCRQALPGLTRSETEDLRNIEEAARAITFMLVGQESVSLETHSTTLRTTQMNTSDFMGSGP